MDVYIGQFFLNSLADVDVYVSIHLGRKTSLYAHFCGAKACSFLRSSHNLFSRKKVAFLFTKVSTKSAKAALLDTDICKINVPVDYICCKISNSPFAELICHHHCKIHFKTGRVKELDGIIY